MSQRRPKPANHPPLRAAIYTRKSVEEGLQLEFNSLDNQYERSRAYLLAQGWTLAQRYDDGGYSGATTDRPAFQQMLADLRSGQFDVIVAYKLDRLSRKLKDFLKFLELLEQHQIGLAIVSQQVDTTTPAGRAMLNLLMVFAELEREQTAERTRDKLQAARRKGLWVGGHSILGYDLERNVGGTRLRMNPAEADQVRAIFALYLERGSLLPVVEELALRGWYTKNWTTRAGKARGGRPYDKGNLYRLLRQPAYIAEVHFEGAVYPAQHQAILDREVWLRTQSLLDLNGQNRGADSRRQHHALLRGLIRCGPCNCAMGYTYASKHGKRYGYYTCIKAMKRGWAQCPSKSIPIGEMERFVIEQIMSLCQHPTLLQETYRSYVTQHQTQIDALAAAITRLTQERQRAHKDQRAAADVQAIEAQRVATQGQRDALVANRLTREQMRQALSRLQERWPALPLAERTQLVQLLIQNVTYDGGVGEVQLTMQPLGLATLTQHQQEKI